MSDTQQEMFEQEEETNQEPIDKRIVFTEEINQMILETLPRRLAEGAKRKEIWKELAEVIGNTPGSVENHYYRLSKGIVSNVLQNNQHYTEEEDEMILSEIEKAREQGYDLQALFVVLGERMGRAAGGVEYRYNVLRRAQNETPEVSNVLAKLRAASRQFQKESYEQLRDSRDEYKKLYEQTKRDLDKLLREVESFLG